MNDAVQQLAMVLPALRPDLEIFPGPTEHDGASTYVIHDPLHATFEKVTWAQMQIIKFMRRPITLAQLLKAMDQTTVKVTADEVKALCYDLVQRGLTVSTKVMPVQQLMDQRHRTLWQTIMMVIRHYFYFRLPLLHPDPFLTATVQYARLLVSGPMLVLYTITAALGLVFLLQHWQLYLHTFTYFFNWSGALQFGIALVLVKAIHEFSHAYTAKAMGNRIPTMGIAFILMWPVPYSDVTDSWRMRNRRKRLLISLAGVIAESIIAAIALFLWAIAAPGVMKSLCFVTSSVTLATTLFINLNPAMRYDGYYVLSDLMCVDNLQYRSFALLKWFFRKHLLGLHIPCPESNLSTGKFAGMIVYAMYACAYRITLYMAIAIFVYYKFTKVIGVMMFAIEVYYFFLQPIVNEIGYLVSERKKLSINPKSGLTMFIVLLVLLWAALPLPRRRSVPGVVVPAAMQHIYVPDGGMVSAVSIDRDDHVVSGQVLVELVSKSLDSQISLTSLELKILKDELVQLAGDDMGKVLLPQKREELDQARSKLTELQNKAAQNQITAQIDGVVVEWDRTVQSGMYLVSGKLLGMLADADHFKVMAYVPEHLINHITAGKRVYYQASCVTARLRGSINAVRPLRAEFLDHYSLSSLAAGDIAVMPESNGQLSILGSYYQVEMEVDPELTTANHQVRFGQPGKLWFYTKPKSLLADLFRYLHRVLVRESSF